MTARRHEEFSGSRSRKRLESLLVMRPKSCDFGYGEAGISGIHCIRFLHGFERRLR